MNNRKLVADRAEGETQLDAALKAEPDLRLRADLKDELEGVLTDPVAWLETENLAFGGKRPVEVIADGNGEILLDRLRAIKYGAFS